MKLTKETRVYVQTPQGLREEGTVIEAPHDIVAITSRSTSETLRVVTVRWDDGDVTDERITDLRPLAPGKVVR